MTLKAEITSDLTTFLNTDEFAEAGTYTPQKYAATHPLAANASTVNGIFEKEYFEVNGLSSTRPTFLCSTTDVSDVTKGARLTVNSNDYVIVGDEQDGTGLSRLILELC